MRFTWRSSDWRNTFRSVILANHGMIQRINKQKIQTGDNTGELYVFRARQRKMQICFFLQSVLLTAYEKNCIPENPSHHDDLTLWTNQRWRAASPKCGRVLRNHIATSPAITQQTRRLRALTRIRWAGGQKWLLSSVFVVVVFALLFFSLLFWEGQKQGSLQLDVRCLFNWGNLCNPVKREPIINREGRGERRGRHLIVT